MREIISIGPVLKDHNFHYTDQSQTPRKVNHVYITPFMLTHMLICLHIINSLKIVFDVCYFPTFLAPSHISSIYGVVVTSQNGGDIAQHIATKGPRSEN